MLHEKKRILCEKRTRRKDNNEKIKVKEEKAFRYCHKLFRIGFHCKMGSVLYRTRSPTNRFERAPSPKRFEIRT